MERVQIKGTSGDRNIASDEGHVPDFDWLGRLSFDSLQVSCCRLETSPKMPLRIRMSVHGRTNYRVFHINVVEGTRKRDAKPYELLGVYDPHVPEGSNTKTIQWSVDRIRYWLSVGALPSPSVVKLLELVSSNSYDVVNIGS